jgi:wee1-like protein kinase
LITSKFQKLATTLNSQKPNHDENCDILAKPINDNNYTLNNNRPKPFPLFNKVHENNLCKIRCAKFNTVIAQEINGTSTCYGANVNPFTPPGISLRKKRARLESSSFLNSSLPVYRTTNTSTHSSANVVFKNKDGDSLELCYDEELNEFRQAPKRLALQESNITRYEKEFVELKLLGVGEFGLVYQCLNRLDGCIYAIKRSIKPVAGSSFEKTSLNEVYAHAVLGKHDHVVRYYSAWAENNHMLIQNEYCNGGSLQQLLLKRTLNEGELKILLIHVAEGLRYIHSHGLVHMDIKAGNIFLTRPTRMPNDDGFDENFDQLDNFQEVVYKIGDLGHVTSVNEPKVEEGDCRYLPNEILQEDYSNLQKADIFSLGITIYEAGGGGPLPKNGPEWHHLRNGTFPDLPGISREFNALIKIMTHPNPLVRPSSTSIFNHSCLCPDVNKSKAELLHELNIERQKSEMLLKKLRETNKIVKSYELSSTPGKLCDINFLYN